MSTVTKRASESSDPNSQGVESAAASAKTTSRLETVLRNTIEVLASARSKKYVLMDKEFDQRLSEICVTLEAIRSTRGAEINIDGESYPIKDYQIPKALINYVSSGLIYGSPDAIGKANPIIRVAKTDAKLSPLVFNKFFSDFNGNQAEGFRIPVADVWNKLTSVTLEDVQYLEDEDGRMAKLHEGGFDIQTCWLIGLSIDGLSKYLSRYDIPTKDGMVTWLSQV